MLMRWIRLGPVAVFLLAASARPAAAAAPGPQVWQVDWEQARCTIATGDPASLYLALWMTPGDPTPELYLVGPADRIRGGGDRIKLTLAPGGKSIKAWRRARPGKAGAIIVELGDLGDDFPTAFASASEVRLTGFSTPISIPVQGANQAMAALNQCLDQKMTEWGIDAKAYRALRTPPKEPVPGQVDWLGDDDYPPKAQAAGQAGDAVVRLSVDARGKVTHCAVVASSGSKPIDDVTCRQALRKARFVPAVGADGRPMAAMRTVRAKFRLIESSGSMAILPPPSE